MWQINWIDTKQVDKLDGKTQKKCGERKKWRKRETWK